ncbi:MAG: YbfB/YjiJ family MFS transporter [Limnobacter sp.]|nr:YbfB/YjiJ family MFS transporter [Limnobacter sp.]
MQPARWQVITAGICALILTVGLARFSYTPMLPIMRAQAELSALDGGLLATLNYLGYISGALLASTLSKLEHKFIMYRAGLVLAAITTTGMGLTQDVPTWLVLRYISGVSSVAGLLIASGLVMNWLVRQNLKTELGLHFAGMGLGIALTGFAVLGMMEHLDWSQQWLVMGVGGVLFFLPAWFWMPSPASASPTAQAQATAVLPPSNRWMALMIATYFCGGFGYVVSATFIVAIVEALPQLTGSGGWVWVVVGLAAVPSSFVWDKLSNLLGDVEALMLAYGLQIISILLPAFSDAYWAGMASAALYGGTFVGIVSLTLSMAGRRFPANPAKAMARMTLSYGLAQIAAPAIAGYIAQHSGTYRGALYMAAIMMGLGMFLLGLLRAEHRKNPIQQ